MDCYVQRWVGWCGVGPVAAVEAVAELKEVVGQDPGVEEGGEVIEVVPGLSARDRAKEGLIYHVLGVVEEIVVVLLGL